MKITLEPKNPKDITAEELEELASAIRISYPKDKVKIKAGTGYTGYGITWYEILFIYILTPVSNQVIEQITKHAITWARNRFNKRPSRPKSITIYGPRGEVLKSIVLTNATAEPQYTIVKNHISEHGLSWYWLRFTQWIRRTRRKFKFLIESLHSKHSKPK